MVRGTPRSESAAQSLFTGLVMPYCAAKGVRGNVDQRIGRESVLYTLETGESARALVEVKLAGNGRFRSAVAKEKLRYTKIAGQDVSRILVIELVKNHWNRIRNLQNVIGAFDAHSRPWLLRVNAERDQQKAGTKVPNLTILGGGNTIVLGDQHLGDKVKVGGDVIGSAVGSGAVLQARDITVFKNAVGNSVTLSAEVNQGFTEEQDILEAAALSEGDRGDAVDALGKMKEELERPVSDVSRLKRLRETIEGIAPVAASVLASSVELAKMFGCGG